MQCSKPSQAKPICLIFKLNINTFLTWINIISVNSVLKTPKSLINIQVINLNEKKHE